MGVKESPQVKKKNQRQDIGLQRGSQRPNK